MPPTVRQKDRREAAQSSYRERSTPFRGTGLLRHALPLWLPGKVRVSRRTVVLGAALLRRRNS